jgi:hypothetical protein
MRTRIRQNMGVLLLAGAAACSREANRPQERHTQAANSETNDTITSQVIDRQGATLQGEAAADDQRASRGAGDGHDATAKAKLAPLPGSSAEGTATLRELGDDVQIALALTRAVPGASRVAVREQGQCESDDAAQKVSASAAVSRETGLGTLLVNEGGQGTLDLTLKDANLKTEGQRSLLGKTLTVYRMLPPAKPGERAERVVACGKIVPG